MNKKDNKNKITRRDFFRIALGSISLIAIGGVSLKSLFKSSGKFIIARGVWQIDPNKCTQCGKCSTSCVLEPSAVKCVHSFDICGYCDLCSGYFIPKAPELHTGAEYRLCPTGAIKRKFIEDPYFEYTIDESLCIGCGKCVAGCGAFGNGSLYLQIRHDRCKNCNECSIAKVCPSDAVIRIDAKKGYLFKGEA